jgi:PEP-CTERM motif
MAASILYVSICGERENISGARCVLEGMMKGIAAVLIVYFCLVLSPDVARAGAPGSVTVIFQGVMTAGSDTETTGPLVGLPFVASVNDNPAGIINDGFNGSVTIAPTSFYLGSFNSGPLTVEISIGGKAIGMGSDAGGTDILAGGGSSAGNNFSFSCCGGAGLGNFNPANSFALGSDFSASGTFTGTAPYRNPFGGLDMISSGAGSVTFDADWNDLNGNFQEVTGTADITQIDVVGIPEPSTWAMLMLGVAIIGFAIRRRGERIAIRA